MNYGIESQICRRVNQSRAEKLRNRGAASAANRPKYDPRRYLYVTYKGFLGPNSDIKKAPKDIIFQDLNHGCGDRI